jgi:flagellar motor switch protein FliG
MPTNEELAARVVQRLVNMDMLKPDDLERLRKLAEERKRKREAERSSAQGASSS